MKGSVNSTVQEVQIKYKPKYRLSSLAKITSSSDVHHFLRKVWNNDIAFRESFYIVLLNRANRVIGYSLISIGGISGTIADVRICLQTALLGNASAVIIAHNHPSGNLNASKADVDLTKRFKEAFTLLDIQLLDHIILSPEKGEYLSFADSGLKF